MLSLCMIVKDEENNLRQCLLSAKEYADEIIVIDTGSMDKTKKIAAEFTKNIFDFSWCNDFAAARNFSISKANNDWILVLDADEVITDFNKDKIYKFIKDENNIKKVGRIKRINPFEDTSGVKRHIERVNRLFNKKYFHYEGIIHEQVTALNGNDYKTQPIDIIADHVGYTKEVIARTDKIKRNITLLKQAVKDNPKDSYLIYQLGKSYFMGKEYEEACKYFESALKLSIDFRYEYEEDLVESYGYALINAERYKDALIIEEYEAYYYNIPDYNFLMGLIYMNNAEFSKSAEYFLKCTEFEEGKIEGVTTYFPYYNIGVIFECLGYREEAIEYYRKCGEYNLALTRLKNLLN